MALMMKYVERVVCFPCQNQLLAGVLAAPETPATRGVIILVGGPQYRVGSHRQFLILSRQLAEAGIPALRFDYRGMGDSEGEVRTFETIEEDLAAAVDVFSSELPTLKEVVIWGLCDAASAALMYAPKDRRISGLVLANPWVRTPEGLAKAVMKHYYGARLLQAEFWRKLVTGKLDLFASVSGFLRNFRAGVKTTQRTPDVCLPFPERMAAGLQKFSGPVLFLLSGQDLTAREFEDMIKHSSPWQHALKRPRIDWQRLDGATHTFSSRTWRDQVGRWTIDWVKSW